MTRPLAAQAAVHGDEMVEEMRRMLLETNPWLLGLTAFVSVLHTLFDFLAFKNDISFWKNNKSMKGLSLGSMLLNLFFQSPAIAAFGFVEEILPFTDVIPTFALSWCLATLWPTTPLARRLLPEEQKQ